MASSPTTWNSSFPSRIWTPKWTRWLASSKWDKTDQPLWTISLTSYLMFWTFRTREETHAKFASCKCLKTTVAISFLSKEFWVLRWEGELALDVKQRSNFHSLYPMVQEQQWDLRQNSHRLSRNLLSLLGVQIDRWGQWDRKKSPRYPRDLLFEFQKLPIGFQKFPIGFQKVLRILSGHGLFRLTKFAWAQTNSQCLKLLVWWMGSERSWCILMGSRSYKLSNQISFQPNFVSTQQSILAWLTASTQRNSSWLDGDCLKILEVYVANSHLHRPIQFLPEFVWYWKYPPRCV